MSSFQEMHLRSFKERKCNTGCTSGDSLSKSGSAVSASQQTPTSPPQQKGFSLWTGILRIGNRFVAPDEREMTGNPNSTIFSFESNL
jgi:hypothetical protein